MSEIRRLINGILALIKWPLVALLLFSLPDMILAFPLYIKEYLVNMPYVVEFLSGFAIYLAVYFIILHRILGKFIDYLETLIHEFTHTVICYMCFNRISDIQAGIHSGYMQPVYKSNWLISISPYFIPFLSFFVMILMLVTGKIPEYSMFLLGILTGFQIVANYKQIHPKQTDFSHAGWVFTILFLLPANILMWGVILSFVDNQGRGVINYLSLSFRSFLNVI